jgi:hypothetical protein
MYERMLDTDRQPTLEEIHETIGSNGVKLLEELEGFLTNHYDLLSEVRFPFGNNYGWGMKYSHKSKHLCYIFFEKGAFTVTIQLGKKELPALQEKLPALSPKTNEIWENRYPCGDGGWIHYRVLIQLDLQDIKELITVKIKPMNSRNTM